MSDGAGWFEGKTHVLPVRVYYEDTDVSGLVYHANYLRYFERGRSEFLRLAGIKHMVLLQSAEPLAWTLRHITLSYEKPARLDDLLHVRTNYVAMSGARLAASQVVRLGDTILVKARVEAALITLEGRPRRIPKDIHAILTPYLVPETPRAGEE